MTRQHTLFVTHVQLFRARLTTESQREREKIICKCSDPVYLSRVYVAASTDGRGASCDGVMIKKKKKRCLPNHCYRRHITFFFHINCFVRKFPVVRRRAKRWRRFDASSRRSRRPPAYAGARRVCGWRVACRLVWSVCVGGIRARPYVDDEEKKLQTVRLKI